jgi:CDP-4-dehydro-6-deoxyglucose reductase, E1
MTSEELKIKILDLVQQYSDLQQGGSEFIAGKSIIPPSGKVIGAKERQLMVEASLDAWLTTGRFNETFEEKLSEFFDNRHVLTTNSGSSANLLALTALTSPRLKERALKPGDEVISVAASFPTTVNPIIQNGLIPVFVDVKIPSYNIDTDLVEQAISEKTKAIMIAHTLGNPFDLSKIKEIADRHGLWLVEDCCDALGSTYNNQLVGTFGDIATLSFYPAHHITMGEGGAVIAKSAKMRAIIESFRDWGRDCYCPPGKENTCNKRFSRQMGSLPQGYDHKYTYTHVGFNLKISDMQAACGVAQLENLEQFVKKRKSNFAYLKAKMAPYDKQLFLPEATANSDPSWFGFPVTIRVNAGFDRVDLLKYLDKVKVGSRLLFAGNIIRQPYFADVNYRVTGPLTNTDIIMNQSLWLGVYPGLGKEQLDYIVKQFGNFINSKP